MNCGVAGCQASVAEAREARGVCARHWWLVTRPLRAKVLQAYREWRRGYGDLEALRAAQQAAVDAVRRRSTA